MTRCGFLNVASILVDVGILRILPAPGRSSDRRQTKSSLRLTRWYRSIRSSNCFAFELSV